MKMQLALTFELILALFLAKVQWSQQLDPEILSGPQTQVVPINQEEVQFSCHARTSAAFWIVNEVLLFGNNIPDWIDFLPDNHHGFVGNQVTRRINVTISPARNGTMVECLATGSGEETVTSDPAFLYLVDVLFPPITTLADMNATALRVTWQKPYNHPNFPVLSYSLTVLNTMEGVDPIRVQYNANETREYVLKTESILTECHNVTFEVTATNVIGPSEPGTVTTGFQIPLDEFVLVPTADVTLTANLSLMINIIFMPPIICWFQEANYELRILDSTTGQRSLPTKTGSYRGGAVTSISEAYDAGVDLGHVYNSVVIITGETGTINATFQFNTSSKFSKQDIPLVSITNSSTITIKWNRPSLFPPNVSISYLLTIRNETDQLDLQEQLIHTSAEFNSYPISHQFYSTSNLDCHNISFVVLARSSDGNYSQMSPRVVNGFPTVLSQFDSTASVEVNFLRDSRPEISITFKFPTICWYQDGMYQIRIFDESYDLEVLSLGPFSYRGFENPRITRAIQTDLSVNQEYRVVVTAASYGENVSTESNFDTIIRRTLPPAPPPSAAVGGIIAGSVAGALLILTGAGIIIIVGFLCHRRTSHKGPKPLYEDVQLPEKGSETIINSLVEFGEKN